MIYVVRHGQTDWNSIGRMQGSTDIPLNDAGVEQAKNAAKELASIKFDAVFSSPLKRARKTCEIIWDGKINFDDRLKERHYGDFEGQEYASIPREELWDIKKNLTIGGIEKLSDLEKRVFSFFDDILKKHSGETILVVCHAGVSRITKGYFFGRPVNGNYITTFPADPNCAILKFEGGRK